MGGLFTFFCFKSILFNNLKNPNKISEANLTQIYLKLHEFLLVLNQSESLKYDSMHKSSQSFHIVR